MVLSPLKETARITGEFTPDYAEILTPAAQQFLIQLARRFTAQQQALLVARHERQERLNIGELPDFLAETTHIRSGDWQIAPTPPDLQDRRVEITGPTERKMVINALNSGAKVFMADFEDAAAPTWANMIEGQRNLRDAVRRVISYTRDDGKRYTLDSNTAVLFVRPRGWHLSEKHFLVDSQPIPGALFDFGLYVFHNAAELIKRGSGPYFYLPKLESHLEARLWNDIFIFAQEALSLPQGTVKATVLIETILGAFEADEILYELREHSAGLNCGRWDYIFSYIKKFHAQADRVLPDRAQVTMTVPFMQAYTRYVIQVCHRRGAHAMGGMAANIPQKDPIANEQALAKVAADKVREVKAGHDGTWVAHPGLVPAAMEIFNAHMPTPNQITRQIDGPAPTAADLLAPCKGTITEGGIRANLRVGIQYLEAWLGGNGCVPLYGLMEDAATAEISRAQVWQWLHHGATLDDGRPFSIDLYARWLEQELAVIKDILGTSRYTQGQFARAAALFDSLIRANDFTEFLTLPAYEALG